MGRTPKPGGKAIRHVVYLEPEYARCLEDVSKRLGASPSSLTRTAITDWLDETIKSWSEEAAAKTVAERAEAKWQAECADPEGAAAWARRTP